ncbi:MAG: hypothetical protein KY460_08680 [Actinobacteria bacterium]|nr:hypothetical protein [Actinomycetota bacterium]
MLLRRDDTPLALVLVWALIGIAVAQGDRSTLIAVAAGVGCAALLVAAVGTRAARRTSTT